MDQAVQRIADILFTIPPLVLAMALVTMLGPSLLNVTIAMAIPRMPNTNRVIRSAVLANKVLRCSVRVLPQKSVAWGSASREKNRVVSGR